MPSVLALCGPTGSGKSTALEAIRVLDLPSVEFMSEPLPADLLSAVEQGAVAGAGAALQRAILQEKFAGLRECQAGTVIVDRWLSEDREVFVELHRLLGNLTEAESRMLA